ncbi:sensor histidine kinase [Bacteroides intestinalis]|jgi:two-component system sensor histidine kinase|uniref:sensor histidine kinase n=1 Tax=Bacteroides intestinalis TaxID=329854 RepID=UPI00189FE6B7|nr:HAMP domain-containing sensor histidine kinase [Bacteroides intestinalis]
MNRKYIILFTTLGLIAILSLQTIWLYNTFILVRNNIYGETNNILDEALTEAIADFSKLGVPEGTTISSGPINDSIPANTYFYDGLWKLGIEVPLCEIDFFAFKLLKRAGIESEFLSCLADPKSGKIYQKSKVQTIPVWGVIKSDIIPIRTDLSQGIQLVLLNPYWTIFKRMGLLMIATAIMMIMVITCIIYQIKIIIRQDKIAKIREDFSYAMIHDMKTPLSSILACTSLLHSGKMDNLPELKEKYFCIVEDEGGHLLNLANKVLTLSKLENHKLEMSRTVFPLEPMVADLIEKFTAKTAKPVHFTTHLQAKEVCADEEYLKEAISNLIDNAIKYSEELVEIDISSLSNATHTLIKVHDNGIGISEKDRKHIFEKFERASAFKRSRLGKVAGFGLGLNYVYQVMDAHEGSVTVNSVEKEFSEFILYIPIKTENYD